MKELSIEQKAKAYDEAIKLAKDSFNYPDYPGFIRADVVFPELKESKDERIRKELIKETKGCEVRLFETVTNDEFVAWLEKQGEQKPAWSEWDRILQDSSISYLCNLRDTFEAKKWDKEQIQKCISWLQSLRPNHWKPSDEQIHWLKWVINRMPDTEKANEAEAVLEELLEQLKKLRNE